MKTHHSQPAISRRPLSQLPRLALVFCSLVASLGAAEPVVETKTHSLFVGGRLLVEVDGKFQEVVGATSDAYRINVQGERKLLPLSKAHTVRIEQTLELSSVSAMIEDFKWSTSHERDGRDLQAWADQAQTMATLKSDSVFHTEQAMTAAAEAATVSPGSFEYAAAQGTLQKSADRIASAQVVNQQTGQFSNRLGTPGLEDNSIEVSFEVYAPKPAGEAYLLAITTFRENGQDKLQYRSHAEPISGLGAKGKPVRFTQSGFPSGFKVESISLHLYADGQEIATNLSERRVELTEDAALRYLTVCYIAEHPKATLAAVPQRVALPVGFRDEAPVGSASRPVYATVASDGSVKQVAADQAGTASSDPYIE